MGKTLTLEIVVTEQCNLACTYCYMNNVKRHMTKETLDDLLSSLDFLMDKYKCTKFDVSYFGGEPLINWELIEYAIPIFSRDSRLTYQTIISNGILLDDKKIDFLKKFNCGFSLSFDGLWNENNRPFVDGSSSLEHYINNKEFYKKFDGSKVMISPTSLDNFVENYLFFVDDFEFSNVGFTIVRDDIWSWEDVEKYSQKLHDLGDLIIQRFHDGKENFVSLFELMIDDIYSSCKFGKRHTVCFASSNGIGVMPDGIIYPCARFGTEGKLPIYNTKTHEFFEENFYFLRDKKISDPNYFEDCEKCEVRLFCSGGCSKSLLEYGDYKKSKPIPQVCEIFKITYRETIRVHRALKDLELYKNYLEKNLKMKYTNG